MISDSSGPRGLSVAGFKTTANVLRRTSGTHHRSQWGDIEQCQDDGRFAPSDEQLAAGAAFDLSITLALRSGRNAMTGSVRPRSSRTGRGMACARSFRIVSMAMIVSGGAVIGLSVSAYGASPTDAPHVMVIMMENESETELLGSPDAPNVNALAAEYGVATESYSVDIPRCPITSSFSPGLRTGLR